MKRRPGTSPGDEARLTAAAATDSYLATGPDSFAMAQTVHNRAAAAAANQAVSGRYIRISRKIIGTDIAGIIRRELRNKEHGKVQDRTIPYYRNSTVLHTARILPAHLREYDAESLETELMERVPALFQPIEVPLKGVQVLGANKYFIGLTFWPTALRTQRRAAIAGLTELAQAPIDVMPADHPHWSVARVDTAEQAEALQAGLKQHLQPLHLRTIVLDGATINWQSVDRHS